MPKGPFRLGALTAALGVLLVLASSGCRQIVAFDDYKAAPGIDESDASDTATVSLPFLPRSRFQPRCDVRSVRQGQVRRQAQPVSREPALPRHARVRGRKPLLGSKLHRALHRRVAGVGVLLGLLRLRVLDLRRLAQSHSHPLLRGVWRRDNWECLGKFRWTTQNRWFPRSKFKFLVPARKWWIPGQLWGGLRDCRLPGR